MVARVFLITLGFCSNKVFKHTALRMRESLSGKHDIDKIFIAKPYPIDKENNLFQNISSALANGYRIVRRHVDSGAAGDFNQTLKEIDLQDDDIVICYDSDVYPVENGWDDAMIRVFRGDKSVDWICLWNGASAAEFFSKTGGTLVVDGIRTEISADWMMASIGGFRGSFLKATGGLVQPRKYYGGVEQAMWDYIVQRGTKKVFLRDFSEDQRIKDANEDPLYRDWKSVHTQMAFPVSFEEWLEIPRAQSK